jgi:hypothetical protein
MEDPLKVYDDIVKIANEEFREEDHPRDSGGQFTSKGGGDSGSDYEEPKNDYDDIEEETIPKKNEYTELMDEKSLAEYEEAIKEENERYGQIKSWKESIKEAEDILEKIKGRWRLDYFEDRELERDIKSIYRESTDDYISITNLDKVRDHLKKYIDNKKELISTREKFYGVLYSGKHKEKSKQFEKTIDDISKKSIELKVYGKTEEKGEKPKWFYDWEKNDQNWIDMDRWDYEDWVEKEYTGITDIRRGLIKKLYNLSNYELNKFDTDKRKSKYAEKRSKQVEKDIDRSVGIMKGILDEMIYVSKLRNK